MPHPITPLGGRWVRPRPIIAVTLIGPGGSQPSDGLLDTGADDTIFSELVAARLGIDLTNAPVGSASGVGGAAVPVRYAPVTLRISDGIERREWTAWVGFTPLPLNRALLGFAGFLQFFTATFHGDREEVELAVNGLYRGT
jgi:predicted aspartyl protease